MKVKRLMELLENELINAIADGQNQDEVEVVFKDLGFMRVLKLIDVEYDEDTKEVAIKCI